MATVEYVQNLEKLRSALVEKRRDAARNSIEIALANKDDRPSTSWANDIAKVQEQIEAIDRAIDDEQKLRGPTSSSEPLRL